MIWVCISTDIWCLDQEQMATVESNPGDGDGWERAQTADGHQCNRGRAFQCRFVVIIYFACL